MTYRSTIITKNMTHTNMTMKGIQYTHNIVNRNL